MYIWLIHCKLLFVQHSYTNTYTHTHTHYIRTCTHTRIHTHMHVHTDICTHTNFPCKQNQVSQPLDGVHLVLKVICGLISLSTMFAMMHVHSYITTGHANGRVQKI